MPRSQQPAEGERLMRDGILANPHRRVLDVGACDGRWADLLADYVEQIDAVEVWQPYIEQFNLRARYHEVFCADIREVSFPSEYQVVILSDVLEHLPFDDAVKLVRWLKLMAEEIYLSLPVTRCEQDGNLLGNPYESHLYHWTHEEVTGLLGFSHLHTGPNPNGLVQIGTYRWSRSA